METPTEKPKEKPYEKMNEEEKKAYCFVHLREGIISSLQSQSTDLTKEQLDKIADVLNNKAKMKVK
jgi:hypothetical protein